MPVLIPIATICLFLVNVFFAGVMPVIFGGQKFDPAALRSSIPANFFQIKTEGNQGRVLGAIEIADPGSDNDEKPVKNMTTAELLPLLVNPDDNYKDAVEVKNLPSPIKKTELKLSVQSALAYDCQSNQPLYSQEGDKPWAIASITKLLTALVFIDKNPGWDKIYQMKKSDRREGGRIYLFTGDQITVKDLFYTSLVASDNTATMALVSSTGLSEEEFVRLMNLKAKQLKLTQTRFNDPVGLSNGNKSTAKEVAIFTHEALANKDIRQASMTKKYQFATKEGKKKIVYNTDDLLDKLPENGVEILGGKTGFIDAAGYCFVGQFTNRQGKEIVTVVLGTKSDKERFSQTEKLTDWVYQSYLW